MRGIQLLNCDACCDTETRMNRRSRQRIAAQLESRLKSKYLLVDWAVRLRRLIRFNAASQFSAESHARTQH